jgi:hypothetical protein
MSTHPYEHIHVHPTPISISERLSQFNLKIHKVGQLKRLVVDEDVTFH